MACKRRCKFEKKYKIAVHKRPGKRQWSYAGNPTTTFLVRCEVVQATSWSCASFHCCHSANVIQKRVFLTDSVDPSLNAISFSLRTSTILPSSLHDLVRPTSNVFLVVIPWLIKSLWQGQRTLTFLRMMAPPNPAFPAMREQRIPSCVCCLFLAFVNDTIASWSRHLYLCLWTDCALGISLQGCPVQLFWFPTEDRPKEPDRTQELDVRLWRCAAVDY